MQSPCRGTCQVCTTAYGISSMSIAFFGRSLPLCSHAGHPPCLRYAASMLPQRSICHSPDRQYLPSVMWWALAFEWTCFWQQAAVCWASSDAWCASRLWEAYRITIWCTLPGRCSTGAVRVLCICVYVEAS